MYFLVLSLEIGAKSVRALALACSCVGQRCCWPINALQSIQTCFPIFDST